MVIAANQPADAAKANHAKDFTVQFRPEKIVALPLSTLYGGINYLMEVLA